ncbi:MAG: NADAR family protein [bacterium]
MKKILYTEAGPNGTEYKKGEWEKFAIHNESEIKGFFGEYRFLSNFWPAKVLLGDVEYRSVELAYQAAKWKPESRQYFLSCTELESIDYNRNNMPDGYPIDEWNTKKLGIMANLITQKFDPELNPENYQKLQVTGNKHLEEMNWWSDLYWGTNKDGEGENNLGKMLMKTRGQEKNRVSIQPSD